MRGQKVVVAPREDQGFREIFTCSYPSPCNIYLAGKVNIHRSPDILHESGISVRSDNPCHPTGAVLRFATEGHSLALFHSDNSCGSPKSCRGSKSNHRVRVGDEYSLSVHRFPKVVSGKQSSNEIKDEKSKNKIEQTPATSSEDRGGKPGVCLAHSSISLAGNDIWGNGTKSLNIEVFAIMGISIPENHLSDTATLGSSNDPKSSATTGSVDNNANDTGDHNSIDASVGAKANAATDGNGAGGTNFENDAYYLTVKVRLSLNRPHHASKKGRRTTRKIDENGDNNTDTETTIAIENEDSESESQVVTRVEKITVAFRPILVHIVELYVKNDDIDKRRNKVIGLFVASADDNKLRLFIASCEKLRSSCEKSHDTSFSFDEVHFSKAFESLKSSDRRDPFVFPAQILSLDTCVVCNRTAGWRDVGGIQFSEKVANSTSDIWNKLAVACYDGTICIYTYNIDMGNDRKGSKTDGKSSNDTEHPSSILSSFRMINLENSTFVVDGPVASLHFGKTMVPAFNGTDEVIESNFLVAGSLCGFACLFYELPRCAHDSAVEFCGPVTLVDGLYDCQGEGFDDCVTAVHACCSEDAQILIAVGTNSGRILLYQPVLPITAYCKATSVKKQAKTKYLHAKIAELRDENSSIEKNLGTLNKRIEEYRTSIKKLSNESYVEGKMDNNDTSREEATEEVMGALKLTDDNYDADEYSKRKLRTSENEVLSPHLGAKLLPIVSLETKQNTPQPVEAYCPLDEMREQRENDEMTGIKAEYTSGSSEDHAKLELASFCSDDTDITNNRKAQTDVVLDTSDQNSYDLSQQSLNVLRRSQLDSLNAGIIPKIDALGKNEEIRGGVNSCLVVDSSANRSSDSDTPQIVNGVEKFFENEDQNGKIRFPIKDGLSYLISILKSCEKQRAEYENQKQAVASSITRLEHQIENLDERQTQNFRTTSYQASMQKKMLIRKLFRYEFAWEIELPYPINGISHVPRRDKGTLDILVSTRRGIHAFRKDSKYSIEIV